MDASSAFVYALKAFGSMSKPVPLQRKARSWRTLIYNLILSHAPQPRMNYRPDIDGLRALAVIPVVLFRSEEHTSELQSLMRNSSAVFCLNKKNITNLLHSTIHYHYII